MGTRAPRTVVRKARAAAAEVQVAVQRRVAARVDGFLEVLAEPPPGREPVREARQVPEVRTAREVREKVARRLKQFHPMD